MRHKNLFLLTIIILLHTISIAIYGQSGNAKSLEVGNKWVYKNWSGYSWGTYEYSYSIEEVIKDTIINDKSYAVIQQSHHQPYYTFFERADSMQIYFPYDDSEYVMINFAQRDTILADKSYIEVDTIDYWGRTRVKITHLTGPFDIGDGSISYIEGIGEESQGYGHGGYYSGRYLVAAYLNGVKYGDTTLVDVKKKELIPKNFELLQNYPNPFNPTTSIQYEVGSLPAGRQGSAHVTLKVFDILGREIAILLNEEKSPGTYKLEFNVEKYRLSSGVYFVKMEVLENNGIVFSSIKKLMLIK